AQETIAESGLPVFALVAVFASVAAATLAFGGGALTAYVNRHHGGWHQFKIDRKQSRGQYVRMTWAIGGVVIASLSAGGLAAAWAAFIPSQLGWTVSSAFTDANTRWRVMLVLGPPVYLLAPLSGLAVLIGLLGRTFDNARREWLS